MCLPIQVLALMTIALGALGLPAAAQTTVPFNVVASVEGASFWVDGRMYTTSASFSWEAGSKHILEIRMPVQYNPSRTTRFAFSAWAAEGVALMQPASLVQTVTADPSVRIYRAVFEKQHRVDIYVGGDSNTMRNLCHPEDGEAISPTVPKETPTEQIASWSGFLTDNACGCIVATTYRWVNEGAQYNLNAYPYPGWVFGGFRLMTSSASAHITSLTIAGPASLRAVFEPGRRHIFRTERLLNYQTAQPFPYLGLKVVVDRLELPTRDESNQCSDVLAGPDNGVPPPPYGNPFLVLGGAIKPCVQLGLCNGERDLLAGRPTVIGVPEVQQDKFRNYWVFDHWDAGGGNKLGQNAVIVPPPDNSVKVYTARFTKGVSVHFSVDPSHLKLTIDGSNHWYGYGFTWGVGHKHTFSAETQVTDAGGRIWEFIGWDHGGPPAQELTPTDEMVERGVRYVARYRLLGRLRLDSIPSGLEFWAGDAVCKTPCLIHRREGERLPVMAPAEASLSNDSKLVFESWDDGGTGLERSFDFTSAAASLTARYRRLEKLTLIADPPTGAMFKTEPAPEPGFWFPLGTQVQITAEAQPGYKFRQFEGALSGRLNTDWLTMNGPATVVARLDKIRQLAEHSVRNAAGETPLKAVAPGSRIAIHGYNLSQESEIGPDQPLAQTLKGVVVQMGSRILPLISVSPDFIEAFLPSDVTPGRHTLTVRSPGEEPVTTSFEVVRNAPGLFRNVQNEMNYALALRGRGELMDPLAGVQAGEQIEILATGLGEMNPQPLDGFAAPLSPPAPVRDAVELIVDGQVRPLLFAGAAPGRTAFQLVRFLVDPAWGTGRNLEVRIRVNGQESNPVLLPVR